MPNSQYNIMNEEGSIFLP